jgi:hypothetical protein
VAQLDLALGLADALPLVVGETVVVDDAMSDGRTPDAVVTGDDAFCEFWYTVPLPRI